MAKNLELMGALIYTMRSAWHMERIQLKKSRLFINQKRRLYRSKRYPRRNWTNKNLWPGSKFLIRWMLIRGTGGRERDWDSDWLHRYPSTVLKKIQKVVSSGSEIVCEGSICHYIEALLINLYLIYIDYLILFILSVRHSDFNPTCQHG